MNICFFGNGTCMNYEIIKYLNTRSKFRPELLLQDYNSILDHPAWDDLIVKIPFETIRSNPTDAKKILETAIVEKNWK